MAPKKKQSATAPAVSVPVKRSTKSKKAVPVAEVKNPRRPGSKKAGLPTRAEKKIINKGIAKQLLAEETAALRKLMPPANPTVIHPVGGQKPVEYDEQLAMKICLKFAADPAMNLMKLNSDPEMPTVWHFYQWLIDYPQLEKAYSRARELQADLMAAELEAWSTEPLIGKKTIRRTKSSDNGDEETVETQEYDNIERARLRVQTRQWLLAKYRPRKYGVQPITVETTGDDALSELITQFRERSKEIEGAS